MELNLSHQTDYIFKSANPVLGFAVDEKDAVWIPYEPGTANRFLMFDLNNNSFAVVLRCAPGSGIDRHYHTGSQWRVIACRVPGSTRNTSGSRGPAPLFTSVRAKRTLCKSWATKP